jgi:hypothetical protein
VEHVAGKIGTSAILPATLRQGTRLHGRFLAKPMAKGIRIRIAPFGHPIRKAIAPQQGAIQKFRY